MEEKILIVDDDASIVKLVDYLLEPEGYKVVSASNGLRALKTVETEKPDLIILDLMLPGVDGFDLCQRLRMGIETSRIPIMILSAKSKDDDKRVAMESGADGYLTKPFNSADLIEQVGNMLGHNSMVVQTGY